MPTSQLDLQFLFLEIFGENHASNIEISKSSNGFEKPMDDLYEISTLKDITSPQGGILASLQHVLEGVEGPQFLEIIKKIEEVIEDPELRIEPENNAIPRLMDFVYPVI